MLCVDDTALNQRQQVPLDTLCTGVRTCTATAACANESQTVNCTVKIRQPAEHAAACHGQMDTCKQQRLEVKVSAGRCLLATTDSFGFVKHKPGLRCGSDGLPLLTVSDGS